jgi:hypothetical protein
VNKNVTTPEGAAFANTLTGFHKECGPTSNIGGSGLTDRSVFLNHQPA